MFTCANKIEAMYEVSRVNVKVERGSTVRFYAQPLIHCVYFIYARKFYARIHVKNTREWKSTLKELKEYILAVEMRERIGKRY